MVQGGNRAFLKVPTVMHLDDKPVGGFFSIFARVPKRTLQFSIHAANDILLWCLCDTKTLHPKYDIFPRGGGITDYRLTFIEQVHTVSRTVHFNPGAYAKTTRVKIVASTW
jgi:hypothetical protein